MPTDDAKRTIALPPGWTPGDVEILAKRARDVGKDPAEVLRRALAITYEQAAAMLEHVEKKAGAQ